MQNIVFSYSNDAETNAHDAEKKATMNISKLKQRISPIKAPFKSGKKCVTLFFDAHIINPRM